MAQRDFRTLGSRPYARIIVPLDGSALAEQILPHVRTLAKAFDSRVELVRAYAPPASLLAASAASTMPGHGPVLDPAPYVAAQKDDADLYPTQTADRLRKEGVHCSWRRLDGSAGEKIVAEAASWEADLILMTTHGRGGLGRLLLGSVTDYVVRHATIPILLVRATA